MAQRNDEYYNESYYSSGPLVPLMSDTERYKARARLAAWIWREIPREAKVFEFGCGPGYNLFGLANQVKEGYDISEKGREASRLKGLVIFDQVTDIPRGKYDVVICSHVLEHVPEPEKTLNLLRSLLRPDGRLELMLPVESYCSIPRALVADYDQHLYTWSPQNIVNLLLHCGFTPVRAHYLPMAGRTLLWSLFGRWPGEMIALSKVIHLVLPKKYRELRVVAKADRSDQSRAVPR